MPQQDRNEYLAQCKRRALEYLDRFDVLNAITSMQSDLGKHDDFKAISEQLMPMALWIMIQNDYREARRFIEGYR